MPDKSVLVCSMIVEYMNLENVAITVVLPPEGSCYMRNIFYILNFQASHCLLIHRLLCRYLVPLLWHQKRNSSWQ